MFHNSITSLLGSLFLTAGFGAAAIVLDRSSSTIPAAIAQSFASQSASPTENLPTSNQTPGYDAKQFPFRGNRAPYLAANPAEDADGYLPPTMPELNQPVDVPQSTEPDNLAPVLSTAYPWSAIGRLEQLQPNGTVALSCTGTLIGKDLVLTNAHCVVDKKTKRLVKHVLRFRPNVINGQARAVAYARRVRYGQINGRSDDANNWALIKLDRLLGEDFGTLGWRSLTGSELRQIGSQLRLVGYTPDFPRKRPGITAVTQQNCQILAEAQGVLYHSCSSYKGAPGSPVLARIDGRYHIVALHAGYLGAKNYAIPVSRWAKAALDMRY